MKKLKLDLSDLKVQSFSTNPGQKDVRGTINAQAGQTDTCVSETWCTTQIYVHTCNPNVSVCPTECAYGDTNCGPGGEDDTQDYQNSVCSCPTDEWNCCSWQTGDLCEPPL